MSRKVQKKKNDQYVITIPKSIAESRDWSQGTELKFKTITRGKHAGKIRLQEADKK
jgi:bifunctional DNA-binding transcriptional regulator/antitoxin component of YhaV-PrlF toxin-antitoxin module